MQDLKKYILNKALDAGICAEWADKIAIATNRGDLLAMYVKGIDFCLEKNFPSNEDLITLGGSELISHGIYVNGSANGNLSFAVLLGASSGNITLSGYETAQLFIKHSSSVHLIITQQAFVVIDCFDNSIVNVTASGESKVLINVYGHAVVEHTATDNAKIRIIKKNKPTY